MSSENREKPKWESILNVVSIAVIPIVIAVVGWWLQSSLQDQSIKRDYVQLAVSILKENDTTKQNMDLRSWAVKLLNENSPVKLDASVQQQLKSGEILLPSPEELTSGLKLFQVNCAQCHAANFRVIGPKLSGVVNNRTKEWLLKMITNGTALIISGDKAANELYAEYNQIPHPNFEYLKTEEIEQIIEYMKNMK